MCLRSVDRNSLNGPSCLLILLAMALIASRLDGQPSHRSPVLVERPGDRPVEEADDFTSETEQVSPVSPLIFNASPAPQEIRSVTISGRRLVFDSAASITKPFRYLDGRRNLITVALMADTVVVRAPVHLPGAALFILAREIIFEGQGSFDTTPLSDWRNPDAADDTHPTPGRSNNGQVGGNISINALTVTLPSCASNSAAPINGHSSTISVTSASDLHTLHGCPIRFIANGGAGQQAGQGRDGIDGTSLDPVREIKGMKAVYFVSGGYRIGTNQWPGDGIPPVADGKPGNGASGGIFSTNLWALQEIVQHDGGLRGRRGSTRAGAQAGEPVHSFHLYYSERTTCRNRGETCTTDSTLAKAEEHVSKAYPSVEAPDDATDGTTGQFRKSSWKVGSWLTSSSVEMTIKYARELYLAGYYNEAESVLRPYSELMSTADLSDYRRPGEPSALDGQHAEVEALLQRLEAHLDYFGNPAGFVPQLSFEYNLHNYESELDFAIPELYTITWLSEKQRSLQSRKIALQSLERQTETEIAQSTREFNSTQGKISELQNDAIRVRNEGAVIQQQLLEKQAQLIERAKRNVEDAHRLPAWQQTLGTLGALCKVIPVYQPALAAVGTGLTTISSAGTSDPLASVQGISDISDALSSANLAASADQFKKEVGSYDPSSYSSTKAFAKAMVPKAKQIIAVERVIAESAKTTEAPRPEVEQAFQKLAAEDAEFKSLTSAVREHSDHLAQLYAEAVQVVQTVASLSSKIGSDTLALISIKDSETQVAGADSPDLDLYLSQMRRRAQDRLLKYHYYVAKSYEYRTLNSYPSNIKLDTQFDRLLRLASINLTPDSSAQTPISPSISADDFKKLKIVYEDPLRQITNSVVEEYNNGTRENGGALSYTLNASELRELNASGRVEIDFEKRGLLRRGQMEQRIRNITSVINVVGAGDEGSLEVRYMHPQRSELRTIDHEYIFTHAAPFYWTSVYDFGTKEEKEETSSRATQSLLSQLAGSQHGETLELFASPSLLGRLTIRTTFTPAESAKNVKIGKLVIKVDYDYIVSRSEKLNVEH